MLGKVVVGGHIFPVTKVRLAKGKVVVEFVVEGPMEAFSGPLTLVGEDGRGMSQGSVWRFPDIRPDLTVVCEYGLTVGEIHNEHVFEVPLS